ncbi:MAG: outer membrane protein assembly factor BamE [Rhodocyclaceae bacterium]
MIRRLVLLLCTLTLSACAGYSGAGLQPGVATEAEVRALMGPPAMLWELSGGRKQLAYPRGPAGFQTYMVFIDTAGKLERTVNVLRQEFFAKVQPGMTQAQVLQLLGPPQPQWEAYFKARDELVWEWRFCDSWNQASRFDVLFDGSSKIVRSASSWQEGQKSNYPIACGQSD